MARFILGVITLLIAAFLSVAAIGGAVAAFWPGAARVPLLVFFLPALFFFGVTADLWTKAIQATEEDDLFSGQRGLLISAMMVTTLLIAGVMLSLILNVGFWHGLVAGLRD
jgi:hypothetical protein